MPSTVPRGKRVRWLLLLSAVLQVAPSWADVRVGVSIADQYPPLAHVNQAYDWQFLPNTFTADGDPLTYAASGLPSWAKLDSDSGRITGMPSKRGSGDMTNHVTVTATDGRDHAQSEFDLVTITAPAPTLRQSLQDQLPQAASMGEGNMLPNKVLHLPLGWSFSVGFQGDTFVLPDDDRVYYTSYLEGAQPLPDWIVFNEEEMTYDGIAPTQPGPNGTYYNIILFGSNRRNTGGPSTNFTIYVAGGIITTNQTLPTPIVNVTEGQPFAYTVDQLNTSAMLVDGKTPHWGSLSVEPGTNAPSWVSFDTQTNNLTGTPPFETKDNNYTTTTVPLRVTHDNAVPMDFNVTLDVYPSAFNVQTLPNATVSAGQEFEVDLAKYFRSTKGSSSIDVDTPLARRDLRAVMGHQAHRHLRRSLPSWLHYDSAHQRITGTAPTAEQQVAVRVSAANPVADAPVPDSQLGFTLFVRDEPHPETAPHKHGLTAGEKGAIAGSILGAALLAAVAGLCFFCYRRRRRTAPATTTTYDAPADAADEAAPAAVEEAAVSPYHEAASPNAGALSPYVPQSERAAQAPFDDIRVVPDRSPRTYGTAAATSAYAPTADDVYNPPAATHMDDATGVGSAAGLGAGAALGAGAGAAAAHATAPRRGASVRVGRDRPRSAASHAPVRPTSAEPPSSPQWQRADDEVNPTPFLSQSTWQPPEWAQSKTSRTRRAAPAAAAAGAAVDGAAGAAAGAEVPWRRRGAPMRALTQEPHTSIAIGSPVPDAEEPVTEAADVPGATMPEKRGSSTMAGLFGGLASAAGLAGLGLRKKETAPEAAAPEAAAPEAAAEAVPADEAREADVGEDASSDESEPEVPQPTILTKLFSKDKAVDEEATITSPTRASSKRSKRTSAPMPTLPSEHASWEEGLWYGKRDETSVRSEIPASEEAPRLRQASGAVPDAQIRPVSQTTLPTQSESKAASMADATMREVSRAPSRASRSNVTGLGIGTPARPDGPAPRVMSQNWVHLDEDTSISYLGPVDDSSMADETAKVPAEVRASEPADAAQAEAPAAPAAAEAPEPAPVAATRAAPVEAAPADAPAATDGVTDLPPPVSQSMTRVVPVAPEPVPTPEPVPAPVPEPVPVRALSPGASLPTVAEEADEHSAEPLSASPLEPEWDTGAQDVPLSPVRSPVPSSSAPISAADAYVRSPPDAALEQFAPWQYGLFSPKPDDAEPATRGLLSSATAPQLAPVPRAGRIGPLTRAETPQLSPLVGAMSPLGNSARFSMLSLSTPHLAASPTMPMDAEPQTVPQHHAQLEEPSSAPRPTSQVAEPQEAAGVFDDADNDPADPFAENQYPYGTVLGRAPGARPASQQLSEGSGATNVDEFNTTEGALAQGMLSSSSDLASKRSSVASSASAAARVPPAIQEPAAEAEAEADADAGDTEATPRMPEVAERSQDTILSPAQRSSPVPAPAPALPSSSTMHSIQMAQSRSVNFTPAKPPRLQLMSCRPDEAISLPLMSSQVSFPQHLLEENAGPASGARYIPQLFAPSRPDLHEKWPSWLAWLAWDTQTQELTGTVPASFAQEHRLPMQLPIHILLERGHQLLQDAGHERPDTATSSAPLLVARILLTILPAAEPRDAGAAPVPRPPPS